MPIREDNIFNTFNLRRVAFLKIQIGFRDFGEWAIGLISWSSMELFPGETGLERGGFFTRKSKFSRFRSLSYALPRDGPGDLIGARADFSLLGAE